MATFVLLALCACEPEATHEQLADVVLEEVAAVGVVQGAPMEEFGRIRDVLAVEDGSFFVLDVQTPAVAWFALDGTYLDGVRSRGAGPGELGAPLAMDVNDSSRLSIVDRDNRRLGTYRFGDGGIIFESATTGEWSIGGLSMCSVGSRRFIRDFRVGYLIHEVDASGQAIASFEEAEPLSSEDYGPFLPLIAPQINAGLLTCLDSPDRIISVSTYLPYVRAFSPDGELLWETEIADFRPWSITASMESGVRYEVDPGQGSHAAQSAVRWSPETLLVQYSISPRTGTPEDRDFFGIESRELALANGEEIGRSEHLPFIVDTQGNLVYARQNLPYPRVFVFTRQD
jgi:hypothetical protein